MRKKKHPHSTVFRFTAAVGCAIAMVVCILVAPQVNASPASLAAQRAANNALLLLLDSISFLPNDTLIQSKDTIAHPSKDDLPFTDSAQISSIPLTYPDSVYPIDGHITYRLPMLDSLLRTAHWHTNLTTGFCKLIPIDSSLLYAHLYDPTLDGPHLKTNLGIDFAATTPDAFAMRPLPTDQTPLFAHALFNLLPLAEGVDSYSSRGPFSQVVLMSNFSTETDQLTGRLFYTQNVTPATNLGLAFDHGDETSAYANFQTRHNAFRAFGSYASKRLYINLSLGFAKHDFKDYGGLANDNDQRDPDLRRQETAVNLTTPHARTHSQAASAILEFDIVQHRNVIRDSLGIQYTSRTPLLSLTSTHHFRAYYRGYTEKYTDKDTRPRYLSYESAIDTVGQQTYTASLGVHLHQLKHARVSLPGLRAAVGYQLDRYIQQRPDQYLTGSLGALQHSLFIEAAAEYSRPYLALQAFAKSYLLGARLGATTIQAQLSYFPLKQEKGYELRTAWNGSFAPQHPFYLYYRSNRFIWDNTTKFHRSFTSTLHAAFIATRWGGEYGVNNATITNYTYLDSTSSPAQLPRLNVLEAYVQQTFYRWGLSLVLRGAWQHASHYAAAVPTVTAYGNVAYQFKVIKNALDIRLGAEAYYRTLFYAPGYSTDLGVFYAQRSMKIGNYPMLNAFLSLKWKNANVFVRIFNVAQGAFGYDFFAAPHYPDRRRSFRLGVNWYFYN